MSRFGLVIGALCVVGAAALAGCSSWGPENLAVRPVPHTLRVTLRDGSTVQVDDALVVGDSTLVGRGFYGDRLSIPTRDVVAVQAQHTDVGKTAALVAVCVGVGIPAAYVLLLLAANICTGPCT